MAGANLLHGSHPPAAIVWHHASSGAPAGVHLTVEYRPVSWGTEIRARVSGLAPGTTCQFVVTDAAGAHMPVGGWTSTSDVGTWYPASTWVGASDLTTFELVVHGHVIVTARS